MAKMKKYSDPKIIKLVLGHNGREHEQYKNSDIKNEWTKFNMKMEFEDGLTPYQRYKKILSDSYNYGNRQNTVKLCEIYVALPKFDNDARLGWSRNKDFLFQDMDNYYKTGEKTTIFTQQYLDFLHTNFTEIYQFFKSQYGNENIVDANIHLDEKGQPHMHFTFVPTVKEQKSKRNKEVVRKLCCKKIWNKAHFANFHANLRDYLNHNENLNNFLKTQNWDDFEGCIGDYYYTGITKQEGKVLSPDKLKAISNSEIEDTRGNELKRQAEECNYDLETIEREKEIENDYFTHDEEEEYVL